MALLDTQPNNSLSETTVSEIKYPRKMIYDGVRLPATTAPKAVLLSIMLGTTATANVTQTQLYGSMAAAVAAVVQQLL